MENGWEILIRIKSNFVRVVMNVSKVLLIPLISRVRGPYGKLWAEFFSFFLWPKREVRGA